MEFGILLVILTTVIFAVVGVLYTRGKKFSIEDYLTARNSLGFWALASSLVASAMGSWILFSPPEVGVRAGLISLI